SRLYYEVARFGSVQYTELNGNVATGQTHQVAVLETSEASDNWRVWVDGAPVTGPIYLPESHGRLTPMAMTESYDYFQPVCNRFAYSFGHISVATQPGGGWRELGPNELVPEQDARYRLDRQPSGIVASFDGFGPAPAPT